ncbi:MAG: glycerophosphodiester phosphodiesterase [Spirochaetes bacterium]|jgi:glycerophosphoryl diester phosphodiesterase|nr:glycerophosphodiester phosphodiesterase [Spirochaetota bacterium]
MPAVTVVAHRGGGGVRPENTLAAFDHAVGLGCSFLELDVRATSDGVPVVIHDAAVDRVTDGHGSVSEYPAAALAELDAGYAWSEDGRSFPFRAQGLHIPALSEVFDRYPRAWISVDIKAADAGLAGLVAELVTSFDRADRTVVGSFSCSTARRFRRLQPHAHASAYPMEVRRMVVAAASGLSPLMPGHPGFLMVPEYWGRVRVVSPAFIRMAERGNKWIFVWTINDTERALRLADAGVHGIITDFPGQVAAALG